MVLQPTGKVLVWPTGDDARVWDPATGTFVQTPATFGDLHCAAQAMLADGRTIVCGGVLVTPHVGTRVTALFDPATNTWSRGAPMHYARWYGTVTVLPDGKVLAASGDDENGNRVTRPEIYDPATNTWTILNTAPVRTQNLYPFMYVLPNGKVYEAGTRTDTASLDVATGAWSAGPTNPFGSAGYAECQAMYSRGKIVRAGGGDPAFARTSVIDMQAATPRWREIAPMAFPRRRHNMVILADGSVLATGGTRAADDASKAILAPEMWNPVTEAWSTMAAMTEARMYHSAAVLLPDGRVVTAGGEATGRLHAQIFSPPYLFKGARPAITSSPDLAPYGSQFALQTPDAASIDRVALLRPCAATHAIDMNERYVPLAFTVGTGSLQVTTPANANEAPPGYYMLVIRNMAGVPSVAAWLRLDSNANLSPGTVTGRVTNATSGLGIAGAQVAFSGGSTTTSGTGAYTLGNVLPGEHSVSAAATGFATVRKPLIVTPGSQVTLDFALAVPGGVTGRVTDAGTGLPLAATITSDGGSVTTDGNGNYSVTGIAPGTQTLSAVSTGYTSATRDVAVVSSAVATANFALTREAPHLEGEIHDATTRQAIAGAVVSYSGGSAVSNSIGFYRIDNVLPGTYTLTARAPGYASLDHTVIVTLGSWTASSFDLAPSGGSAITLVPVADALTVSASIKNHGLEPALRVHAGSPVYNSFLQFVLPVLGGPVTSAKLRLYCTDPSDVGGQLFVVANGWTETGINSVNAPVMAGTPLGQLAAVVAASWVEFDVTSVITSNTTISFGLSSPSTNSAYYGARESAQPPQLVVQAVRRASITGFTPETARAGTEIMIMGDNLGAVSAVRFNGLAASFSLQSATMVHAVVPVGATTGPIEVATPTGNASSATNFVVIASTPTAFVFHPSQDASVFSGGQNLNYGTEPVLRARKKKTSYKAYVKFDVTGVGRAVTSAKLRLYATDASSAGGTVSVVGNSYKGSTALWTETGLNWNNSPAVPKRALATVGRVVAETWVEWDVTAAVQGNGTVSLALTSNSSRSAYYSSKEGAHAPELVLQTAAAALTIATKSEPASETQLPLRFEAFAGFPNPFASRTTFAYALPRSGRVQLEIYDVAGRLIRTLVDGNETAGRKRVAWDSQDSSGRRSSNGIYFYRLRYEREVRTGKLLLRR